MQDLRTPTCHYSPHPDKCWPSMQALLLLTHHNVLCCCVALGAYSSGRCTQARFHSAGREDVDVRMLGSGRPFLLEILTPRTAHQTAEALEQLTARVNASGLVEVRA